MNLPINTFGKSARLKGVKSVTLLFGEGKSFFSHPFRVVWIFTPLHTGISTRTGISVPKSNFKRAVDRNHIKRLFRESWRIRKNEIDNLLAPYNKEIDIMFIYTGREIPSLLAMNSFINKAVAKFSLLLQTEIKKAGETGSKCRPIK